MPGSSTGHRGAGQSRPTVHQAANEGVGERDTLAEKTVGEKQPLLCPEGSAGFPSPAPLDYSCPGQESVTCSHSPSFIWCQLCGCHAGSGLHMAERVVQKQGFGPFCGV